MGGSLSSELTMEHLQNQAWVLAGPQHLTHNVWGHMPVIPALLKCKEEKRVQGLLQLPGEFQISLDYMRPVQKVLRERYKRR